MSAIEEMINKYFDGELTKNEELVLFSQLSQNIEAIEYFKKMNILRNLLEKTKEEFPFELEERIFSAISSAKQNKKYFLKKLIPALSYAVSAVLLIISVILYAYMNNNNTRYENLAETVKVQNKTIELLFNSLPSAEVKAKWDNEIIIKANL